MKTIFSNTFSGSPAMIAAILGIAGAEITNIAKSLISSGKEVTFSRHFPGLA